LKYQFDNTDIHYEPYTYDTSKFLGLEQMGCFQEEAA